MAIFSRIKSAISRALAPKSTGITPTSSAKSSTNVASAFSAVSSLGAGRTSPSTAASVAPARTQPTSIQAGGQTKLPTTTLPQMSVLPSGGSSFQGSVSPDFLYTGSTPSVNSYGGQTPITLSAGGRSSGITTGSTSFKSASEPTFDISGTNLASGFDGGGSLNSNVLAGSTSTPSAPSAPNYSNVGQINTAGIDMGLSDTYTKDANGQYIRIQKTPEQLAQEESKKAYEDLLGFIPKKDNIYDDAQVQAQQAEVQRRQQELNNYTSQLNQVIAKQNADLLTLRGIGAQEGVTETVYGGQQATINREAAIKALPIQAQIATAQGNLQLAQDYLSQLKEVRQSQIDADFTYNMAKFDSIKEYVKGAEARKWEQLKTNEQRAYQETQKNIDMQDEWAKLAKDSGKANLISRITALNPASPDFRQKLGVITSEIPAKGATGGVLSTLPTSIQNRIISIAQGVGDSQIGKKYNATVDSINTVNGIDFKSKNPADHQAIVYAFAKALDPDSVVREGEYATIKKYAQSAVSRYGKEISNAINGTGFLSEGAIKNIQDTMNNLYTSRKPQYDNLVSEQSRIINNVAGFDVASEIMVNYTGGATPVGIQSSTVLISPDGTQQVSVSDLTPEQIQEARDNGWK